MKNHSIILIFLLTLLVGRGVVKAQQTTNKAQRGVFALTHATIVTVTQETITDATLLVRNGVIDAVGKRVVIPPEANIIDVEGMMVYPGMIDAGTRVGLSEVGSDHKTQDYEEKLGIVPQLKALTAVNPNSVIVPVTRVSGVTTVLAKPDGGILPGQAALINLHGYTPRQMYAGFECVMLNFPSTAHFGGYDRRKDEDIKKNAKKKRKKLDEVWNKVKEYHALDSTMNGKGMTYYPEMEALLPVMQGKRSLMIEVNAEQDIRDALVWVKEQKIKKVIFSGVAEGWRVAEDIAKANIPVIVGPVIAIPTRSYDSYDRAYANPGLMHKAGVKVALRTNNNENARNLPYHAGFAATYGMGKEEALRAMTIVPAEIFGVDNRMGSIEKGKSATFFVADGDPMETKTQIRHLFIDGWKVPLQSRHTRLYDEFLERSPGLKKN